MFQHKVENFAHTRLFMSSLMMRGHRFCVLFATPSAKTGLDQPKTKSVIRYGLPRDPTTLLQEKGRLVCQADTSGDFSMFADWAGWIVLVVSSLSPFSRKKQATSPAIRTPTAPSSHDHRIRGSAEIRQTPQLRQTPTSSLLCHPWRSELFGSRPLMTFLPS